MLRWPITVTLYRAQYKEKTVQHGHTKKFWFVSLVASTNDSAAGTCSINIHTNIHGALQRFSPAKRTQEMLFADWARDTKHFLRSIRRRHPLQFFEIVRWESVPRGSFARTWKLSSCLFSRPDWLPLGLRGWSAPSSLNLVCVTRYRDLTNYSRVWCQTTSHFRFTSSRTFLACENICFSSLFVAEDVSRGGTSASQRQKFHTDDAKSSRNPVRSANWSTE